LLVSSLSKRNLFLEIEQSAVEFHQLTDEGLTDGVRQLVARLILQRRLEDRVEHVAMIDAVDVLQRQLVDRRGHGRHVKHMVGLRGCRQNNVNGQPSVAANLRVERHNVRHLWERLALVRHVDLLHVCTHARRSDVDDARGLLG